MALRSFVISLVVKLFRSYYVKRSLVTMVIKFVAVSYFKNLNPVHALAPYVSKIVSILPQGVINVSRSVYFIYGRLLK